MNVAEDLRNRIEALTLADRARLQKRLNHPLDERGEADLATQIGVAEQRLAARRAAVPPCRYPAELPITARREDLLTALGEYQVLVVAGETGSGKSTQLPKLCLEAGRGVLGMIGHTQPRRLAARTVAERVADELGTTIGAAVGYTVRFTDRVGDNTLVKVMTDGVLLAEIQRDRDLSRYDTLIIDEAHERSLNIDFLLGYLHHLLPRRPDLKLIITSATIDTERFANHFRGAHVVEVSGRSYPVEMRYQPLGEGGDQTQGICDAVTALAREGPGDVLVFLSGEREIRDAADALRALDAPDTEILPLYARLSAAEQHRVFQAHSGRRIVLATNVAETSLTVPGIRYVVDPGTARISRYNRRTKVQRLPIEDISQASANQRAGRCGRVAPGICIRLYDEADFTARPEFTEPEIQRTNLASVVLQMAAIGLVRTAEDVAAFPFVDPPDNRSINDGLALLDELGALDEERVGTKGWLTPVGRDLARLPIDPRLGRMVLEARRHDCAREVMVLAAALSIQDPRERPAERLDNAVQSHARFTDPDSDFGTLLNLWRYLQELQHELSSSAFRRRCRSEFLNFLRVREWQDLYRQLRSVTGELGIRVSTADAHPDDVHRSLLAGLLSQIGFWDPERRDYRAARNARFTVGAGSSLRRKSPRWVMAAELVETNRLTARTLARIQPEWAEQLAPHLVRYSYGEPSWQAARGSAVIIENASLYGLPLVSGRWVQLSRIVPELARELFIRHALIAGEWAGHHPFIAANRATLADVQGLEARTRRADLVVDDETLYSLYDQRVGAEVTSTKHFERWWKEARKTQPELLTFAMADLLGSANPVDLADYPDHWHHDGLSFPLTYVFDPGAPDDGLNVEIPLAVLNQVSAVGFDWLVPGYRAELMAETIRSLPKVWRRQFLPLAEVSAAVTATVHPGRGPLVHAVGAELEARFGVKIPADAWQPDRLPDHLRMTFHVLDDDAKELAVGKNLDAVRALVEDRVRVSVAAAAASSAVEQSGLRAWTIGTLPAVVEVSRGGQRVRAFPALVDEGDSAAVRLLPNEAEQADAHWLGTVRLLRLGLSAPAKQFTWTNDTKLALASAGYRTVAELTEDCVRAVIEELMVPAGGPPWDEAGFYRLLGTVKDGYPDVASRVHRSVGQVLAQFRVVAAQLLGTIQPFAQPAVADVRAQLDQLVFPGFVTATGVDRLGDLVRYLQAIDHRLQKVVKEPRRDEERMLVLQRLERLVDALGHGLVVDQLHWMIQELRVSQFAQHLGTPTPVSEKRVMAAIEAAAAAR